MQMREIDRLVWSTAAAVVLLGTAAIAHVTPVAVMRRQADVIKELLPGAVRFAATDVRPDRNQLAAIAQQARYTPHVKSVRFYEGRGSDGHPIGAVLFPQIETQHGPLEVGVGIGPDGAVLGVRVARATVEMKPWILDVERSGILDQLTGSQPASGPVRLPTEQVSSMGTYAAQAIAAATYRAAVMWKVLRET